MRPMTVATFVAIVWGGLSISSVKAQTQQTPRETFERLDANGDMVI